MIRLHTLSTSSNLKRHRKENGLLGIKMARRISGLRRRQWTQELWRSLKTNQVRIIITEILKINLHFIVHGMRKSHISRGTEITKREVVLCVRTHRTGHLIAQINIRDSK